MSELRPTKSWDEEFDVVVLGSGVSGLTAALVAAIEGKRTLLVEKSDQIGGTTARSSGSVWTPNKSTMRDAGITGDDQVAMQYLDALVGERADRALRQAFIAAGPEMLDYLEKHADVRFQMYRDCAGLPTGTTGRGARRPATRASGFRWTNFRQEFRPRGLAIAGADALWRMMITRGEAARLLKIRAYPQPPLSWARV